MSLEDPPEEPPPTPPDDPDHDHLCECCECCLRVIKAELAASNEQRQLLINMASRLPTIDELRGLIGELRATPLPVKLRW